MINWEEFGEKICGSFCTANEARKCAENFAQFFAQFFAQTSARVKKICRRNFALGKVRRKNAPVASQTAVGMFSFSRTNRNQNRNRKEQSQGFPDRKGNFSQQVLNLTPLNPTPATCHKRKRKLRCSFWSAALQELHCNIVFSAVRKSFGPKTALQQTKNCTATSKKLRCRKVALSCRFPAAFKPPRLGTHVSDLLIFPGVRKSLWQSQRSRHFLHSAREPPSPFSLA